MSKRAALLLSTMLATLVAASGVALAANQRINCQTNVVCNGTNQNDTLIGTAEGDTIHGLGGDDLLFGLAGADSLYGEGGLDHLIGGTGGDALHGGPGNDVSNGGVGQDGYYFEANNWGQDTIVETNTEPNNGIQISSAVTLNLQFNLRADNTRNPEVSDAAGINGTNTVNWSGDVINLVFNYGKGDDTIFANDGQNVLRSHNGSDQVYAEGGDDLIDVRDVGLSSDYVNCGPGNDTVYVDTHIQGDLDLPADIVDNCESEEGPRLI
jgi:Ca2+-binding RTX toxin-like protein